MARTKEQIKADIEKQLKERAEYHESIHNAHCSVDGKSTKEIATSDIESFEQFKQYAAKTIQDGGPIPNIDYSDENNPNGVDRFLKEIGVQE